MGRQFVLKHSSYDSYILGTGYVERNGYVERKRNMNILRKMLEDIFFITVSKRTDKIIKVVILALLLLGGIIAAVDLPDIHTSTAGNMTADYIADDAPKWVGSAYAFGIIVMMLGMMIIFLHIPMSISYAAERAVKKKDNWLKRLLYGAISLLPAAGGVYYIYWARLIEWDTAEKLFYVLAVAFILYTPIGRAIVERIRRIPFLKNLEVKLSNKEKKRKEKLKAKRITETEKEIVELQAKLAELKGEL